MNPFEEKDIKLDPVMTVTEVAKYLKVSRQTVYNLINDGKLKVFKIGNTTRILKEDLEMLIDMLKIDN